MEQMNLYHTLFTGSFAIAVIFLILTIVLYIKLKMKETIRFFKRNKIVTAKKMPDFRIEREIIMIHTNEIIE